MSFYTKKEYKFISKLIENGVNILGTDNDVEANNLLNQLAYSVEVKSSMLYQSMDDIIDSMKNHVRENGREINLLPYKNYNRLEFCWADTESGYVWRIGLSDFVKCISVKTPSERDLLDSAFKTSKGKVELASLLNDTANRVLDRS